MQRARECTDLRLPCIFSLIRGSPAREYTDRNIVRVNLRTSVKRKANQIPWQSMHASIRVFRWEFHFDQRTGHLSNPVCNRWMRPVIIINRSSCAAWKSRDVQSETRGFSRQLLRVPLLRARENVYTRGWNPFNSETIRGGISVRRFAVARVYIHTYAHASRWSRSRGLARRSSVFNPSSI